MSASTQTLPGSVVGPRSIADRFRLEIIPLYLRALRNTIRIPATIIPPLIMPIFFLLINTAQLGENVAFANGSGPPGVQPTDGIDFNYLSFFVPVSLTMTIATAGNSSGLSLVQDVANGFFDKLLLTPISRTSILFSRLMVDGTRAALQALIIVIVGLAFGARIAAGVPGVLLSLAVAFIFGMAFAGLSLSVALRTGSPEATQASFVLFFPMIFLAPTFVPLEALPGWLQTVAQLNPMTYVIQSIRAIFLVGIDWGEIVKATVAVIILGSLGLGNAFRALAKRASA